MTNLHFFFKLSSAGIIRLPRFEMAMAKPEANNKPILAAEDVHIITVYVFLSFFHLNLI